MASAVSFALTAARAGDVQPFIISGTFDPNYPFVIKTALLIVKRAQGDADPGLVTDLDTPNPAQPGQITTTSGTYGVVTADGSAAAGNYQITGQFPSAVTLALGAGSYLWELKIVDVNGNREALVIPSLLLINPSLRTTTP